MCSSDLVQVSRGGPNLLQTHVAAQSRINAMQVLQDIETNRLRSEHLLERVAQNTEPRVECVTLGKFIKSQPPVFAESKEPIDADD